MIMDTIVDESSTATFTNVESDPQFTGEFCRIKSRNKGFMQIINGEVNCSGSKTAKETFFKFYRGGLDTIYVIFECKDGNSRNFVVCVDSDNKLSARRKANNENYVNIGKAKDDVSKDDVPGDDVPGDDVPGDDVMFAVEADGNSSLFKSKKIDRYMGFDVNGKPMPFNKVDKSKDEAKFDIMIVNKK